MSHALAALNIMMAIASRRHYYKRKFALQLRKSCTNFCQEDEDVGKQWAKTATTKWVGEKKMQQQQEEVEKQEKREKLKVGAQSPSRVGNSRNGENFCF